MKPMHSECVLRCQYQPCWGAIPTATPKTKGLVHSDTVWDAHQQWLKIILDTGWEKKKAWDDWFCDLLQSDREQMVNARCVQRGKSMVTRQEGGLAQWQVLSSHLESQSHPCWVALMTHWLKTLQEKVSLWVTVLPRGSTSSSWLEFKSLMLKIHTKLGTEGRQKKGRQASRSMQDEVSDQAGMESA